jgi:hypothetical protein
MLRLLCRVIARATDSGDGPAERIVSKRFHNQVPVDMQLVEMHMRGTSRFGVGRDSKSCFDKRRAGAGDTLVQTRPTFEFKQRIGAARCEFRESIPEANLSYRRGRLRPIEAYRLSC